ncbi:MAG: 2Fe-2S iron-sulfur cluster binding domain-containing protein [Oligoflexales bacterium]|nr:2Fe-2S iron-sulfur cluster binding domain-containing protein [Oligoflexales bacterium]
MPPTICFLPEDKPVQCEPFTKILAAAIREKVNIRFGCAACRCGTCAVAIETTQPGTRISPMQDNEMKLLSSMGLNCDGSVRLACQTKIEYGEIIVDLEFQDSYDPDKRIDPQADI